MERGVRRRVDTEAAKAEHELERTERLLHLMRYRTHPHPGRAAERAAELASQAAALRAALGLPEATR